MAFDDLAPQTPINAEADRYGGQCLALSRAVAATTTCTLDVPYGPGPEHRLDVYHPEPRPETALPVLIFLHGGGFTHGYKEWCGFMAPALAPAILVAVRYGLLPGAPYPRAFLDAVSALAWCHAHIEAFGGDPRRTIVGGHSAGGAMAATMHVRPDWLADAGLEATAIAGVVCLSTTFHAFAVSGSQGGSYASIDGPLPRDPESPLARIDAARAPFFIAWGGRERQRERVERSSLETMVALRARGVPVEWRFLEDADHFATHLALADPSHPLSTALRQWITSVAPRDPRPPAQPR